MLVVIREEDCIGCTKCIQACPVDAILGSANRMHTVITDECIGCELCIPPCPVDCIDLVENKQPSKNKELTLKRSRARKERLKREMDSPDGDPRFHGDDVIPTRVGISKDDTRLQNINQTLERIKSKLHR